MLTLLVFILTLAVLVIAHEAGHFLMARLFKVPVEEFGVGFPPRVKAWKKGPTEYSVNWIPLGGFVRIKGENNNDTDPRAFNHQAKFKRFLILVAGVAMNFVVGWLLIAVLLGSGLRQPLAAPSATAVDVAIQVVDVSAKSLAAELKITAGDEILKLDGQILTFTDQLRDGLVNGNNHRLLIRRGENVFTQAVTFKEGTEHLLGVAILTVGVERYPWYRLPGESLKLASGLVGQMFKVLGQIIGSLVQTSSSSLEVAGPVGVAVMTGQAFQLGWVAFLQFVAFLSLNLAVINILPIPALDGGRLLFLGVEAARGRPARGQWEKRAHQIAYLVLLILVLLITIRDVRNFLF